MLKGGLSEPVSMNDTGRHTAEAVTLARLPSGVELSTTVHVYDGFAAGPTVYVQAAQHGREVNGTEVLRRLDNRLDPDRLAGRVVAVPVVDPLTFDHVSYTTPEALDSVNPNMNRVWPGDTEGTLHERMAATLWEYASDADAVVDLHTGSPDMLTHVVFMEGHEDSRRLAEAFGTDLLLSERSGDEAPEAWQKRSFDGKFRVAAAAADIPAITPELAHNKQLVEDAVVAGLDGLVNVFRELDMLSGDPAATDPVLARNHLGSVEAAESGLFRPNPRLELGQRVTEGTRLGVVYDPTTYDTVQQVTATRSGVLYALTKEATVKAGDRLASAAIVRERPGE
jgi:predicted deacylase